jgi:hypothetical protein
MDALGGIFLGLMILGVSLMVVIVPLTVVAALGFLVARWLYQRTVGRWGWSVPTIPGTQRVPRIVKLLMVCAVLLWAGLPQWALRTLLVTAWCSTHTTEVPSPDGRYIAFIETGGCGGAAGGVYTDVGIRWNWDRVQLRSEVVAASSWAGLKPPRLEWTDERTLTVGGIPTRVQEWDGVRIEHTRD